MSAFRLGVVSNAWGALLGDSPLEEQCRRAHAAGFSYVELRQRGLGDCEESVSGDPRPWPLPDSLALLAHSLPELGFNLAVEAPFLAAPVSPDDPYVRRAAAAAAALGGSPPVLRLVDLTPVSGLLEPGPLMDEVAGSVGRLAASLWTGGVRLALENSRQPLSALRQVIHQAARDLPEGTPHPQICWDPHNQISQDLFPEDPVETAATLPLAELFEFHFKQGPGGTVRSDVTDGEIDWRAILSALHHRGYQGPALFEIPAGPDIWERLARSADYIRRLLAEVAGVP